MGHVRGGGVDGSCRVMRQVSCHSTSTDPASVTVNTFTAVYVPLVLKQDWRDHITVPPTRWSRVTVTQLAP